MSKPTPNLNPMFRKKSSKPSPFLTDPNVRKLEEKPARQKRGDAKHDVKIPISPSMIRKMEFQAFHHKLSLTSYAAVLIKKGLRLDRSLFPEVSYNPKAKPVHCKLPGYVYERLFHFKVDWQHRSMRETAHRILVEMLLREE